MATAGCRAVFITSHAFFNTALEVQSHDCARVVAHYSVHVHTHWHWHYSAEACVRACVRRSDGMQLASDAEGQRVFNY